ncbi:hypothetical protein UM396_13950 [Geobacillus subterraneus]|uniref:hypothetical protein n=1 Tax=Geobacillus subterraneus TaxID=129338 RepID=UPI002AC9927D|nr:hypothetical protein [Geobacillus subterraneus]WPZ17686.1 hypothetical protein UM396_13950 [Geobacillus subterraneus]
MAERWKKLIVFSAVAVVAAVAGWLWSAGRAAAAGQESEGFVIQADKVVGTLDLGGIVLKAPVILTGDMPIAFIQANIYGMTLTQQQTIAGRAVSFTFHTDQVANTKWMKMRVKKMKVGGLCTDGVPLVEQCLKDVTVVATELTADELTIPQLSAAAAFGTVSMEGGRSAESSGDPSLEAPTETVKPAPSDEKANVPTEPETLPNEPSSAAPDNTSGSPGSEDGTDPPSTQPAPEKEKAPSDPAQPPSAPIPSSPDPAGGLIEKGKEEGKKADELIEEIKEEQKQAGELIERVKEEQKKTGELIEKISEAAQSGASEKTLDGVEQMVRSQAEQLVEQLQKVDAVFQQTSKQLNGIRQGLREQQRFEGIGAGQRLPLSDAEGVSEVMEQASEQIEQYEAQLEQLAKVKQQLEQQKKELNRWLQVLP